MIQSELTTKIWYLLINGNQEGPFSFDDLKRDRRINPDTLARKEDWKTWKPIREIPELLKLFSKKGPSVSDEWENEEGKWPQGEVVLGFGSEPPQWLWVLIAIISLIYVIFQLYG